MIVSHRLRRTLFPARVTGQGNFWKQHRTLVQVNLDVFACLGVPHVEALIESSRLSVLILNHHVPPSCRLAGQIELACDLRGGQNREVISSYTWLPVDLQPRHSCGTEVRARKVRY